MSHYSFSKNISVIRKTYKFTLIEFASLINMKSKGSLSMLENAKNPPSFETLLYVSDVFCVSLDWLVGYSCVPYTEDSVTKAEDKFFKNLFQLGNNHFIILTLGDYLSPEYRASNFSLSVRANILVLLRVLLLPKLLCNVYEPSIFDKIISVFRPITYEESSSKEKDWIDAYNGLINRQITTPVFDITKES